MTDYDKSLARMLVTLMNAQEQEWTRVSRVLHDDVSQIMSAVGLQLDVLRMDLQEKVPEIAYRTTELQELLERAITLVRNLSYELNPAVVEKAGLEFAMDRLIGRYRREFSGTIRLMVDLGGHLSPEVASAMYKIANQALANAVRHSQCAQVEVLVKPAQKGTVLEICDEGVGFDVAKVKENARGLGLLLMEYYASQANLSLTVTSTPGKGTLVKAAHLSVQKKEDEKEQSAKP